MIATRLKSSNLNAARYDPTTARLIIEFRNESTYEYSRVPVTAFVGLVQAGSPGRFFHAHIKPRYACRKISR